MSWPTIAKCYQEIVKDPSMPQLFPQEEWMSVWELPLLGAVWFRIISERLFAHLTSPAMQGKDGVE